MNFDRCIYPWSDHDDQDKNISITPKHSCPLSNHCRQNTQPQVTMDLLFITIEIDFSFAYYWASSEWNHTECILLCLAFLSQNKDFEIHSLLFPKAVIHSFSRPSSILWHGYTRICLAIYFLMDMWVIFSFGAIVNETTMSV